MHHQNHHRLKNLSDVKSTTATTNNHNHAAIMLQAALAPLRSRPHSRSHSPSPSPSASGRDYTSLLSDELILRILSHLPSDYLHSSAAAVSRRWLRLCGLLRHRLSVPSSLLPLLLPRFPNLTHLSLLPSSSLPSSSSTVLLSHGRLSVHLDPDRHRHAGDFSFLSSDRDAVDSALEAVSKNCPNLTMLSIAGASDTGMVAVANACDKIQEMELHCCRDLTLRFISGFINLQILKIVGSVEGLYTGPGVTDIGLTILAHGCKRLVKLELSGCEGSYDGISAIRRCCVMLEELTLCDHRMDGGWMAGLGFCANLKSLRLVSCRKVDEDPGALEHLGTCPAIERVQLQRCQLRDQRSLRALFVMCQSVREIVFQNCWGLDDDMFGVTSMCRRVKLLSLEGCSQLTTEGLESVILSWTDLKSLTVVACNNVRDDAVAPALSNLFTVLKEFKWRPDSKSILATSLAGTGMGKKGGRFFRRV